MLYEKKDFKNNLGIQKIEMDLPTIWNEGESLASVTVTLSNGEKITDIFLNQYDTSFWGTEIEVKIPQYAWSIINNNHPISENSFDEMEKLLLSTYKAAENHFSEVQVKMEHTPAERLLLKSDEAFNTVFTSEELLKSYLDIMAHFPTQNIYNDMAIFIQKQNASDLRTLQEWQNEGFSPADNAQKIYLLTSGTNGYKLSEFYDISSVHNPNERISVEDQVLRGKEVSKPESKQLTLSDEEKDSINSFMQSSDIIESITKISAGCSSDTVIQNVIGYVLAKRYNIDTSTFDVGTLLSFKNNNSKSANELKQIIANIHSGVESALKGIKKQVLQLQKNREKYNKADRILYEKTNVAKPTKVKSKNNQTEKRQNTNNSKTKNYLKNDKTEALLKHAEKGIKEVFESNKYKQYLKTMSMFHNYSPRNTMLIMQQKPNATKVAGFNTWQKIDRYVKRGEKGIKIIAWAPRSVEVETKIKDENGNYILDENGKEKTALTRQQIPNYKAVTVFDVSQTQGEPLPELTNELKASVKNYTDYYNSLAKISKYPINFADEFVLGTGVKGNCDYSNNTINIKKNMSESQTIKTLVHEIAHLRLHSDINNKITRQQMELEAESVAFVVCEHLGIDTSDYSFPYLASWSENKELKVLESSLTRIQKEANVLITEFDEAYKEITMEKSKKKEQLNQKTPMKEQIAKAKQQATILNGNCARQRQQQLTQANIQNNRKEVARNVK